MYPGGVGFSNKLYKIYKDIAVAALGLVSTCDCVQGCPSCVGPAMQIGEQGKSVAIKLLEYMRDS